MTAAQGTELNYKKVAGPALDPHGLDQIQPLPVPTWELLRCYDLLFDLDVLSSISVISLFHTHKSFHNEGQTVQVIC